MERHFFERDGVALSYLDTGNSAPLLLCLHGHFGCARNFAPLARSLGINWRVIALDQRGHGWSDRHYDSSRTAYVADAAALIEHLGQGPAVILGHSLGGVNAYQLAARRPDLVRALIIEDIGTVIAKPEAHLGLDWPTEFATISDAIQCLTDAGIGADRFFLDSLVEAQEGWRFRFDPHWISRSNEAMVGDWSEDWRATTCPVQIISGAQSWATTAANIRRMVEQRPGVSWIELDGGHTLHDERPAEFLAAVTRFLGGP